MNVHHLELFYYVAKHGGIMPAVRNIPYGIQQPAVSAQVAQLEEFLGVTLFHRRPFSLTPAGEKLFEFVSPFFSKIDLVAGELQGGQERHFRLGASTIILRDHLPRLLQGVKKKFPGVKVSLREGYAAQLVELIAKGEVDMVITLMEREPQAGFQFQLLLELPMVLLVPQSSQLKSVQDLFLSDKIDEALICLPSQELLSRLFQGHLTELGIEWFPSIEASSIDLIETYVAAGLGVGMSVKVPGRPFPENVRALPLENFPPARIGALWHGKITPLLDAFLNETKRRAKEFV